MTVTPSSLIAQIPRFLYPKMSEKPIVNVRLLPLTLIAALSAPAFATSQSVDFDLTVGQYRATMATRLGTLTTITHALEPRIDECTLRSADSEARISTKLADELSATLLPISFSHNKLKAYVEITRLVILPTDTPSVKIADGCSLALADSQTISVRRLVELPINEAYEFKLSNGESVRLSAAAAGKID
ncbi:hypothetical protein [Pseudomonas sp. JUb52]|uniref:hypothetical protein n=1 Tax=Pseudomonas sp. JUb52 TaxID=2485127 RepID=UPI0010468FC4|nr:hypothetical protein [Pseudomonas sp. JUb52]